MTQEQKEIRKDWRLRLSELYECTKLNPHDPQYMYQGDLIEVILDIPEYDISDSDRKKWLSKLGVEQ